MDTTTDPYYRGTFEFGQRKPHCWAGSFDPAVGVQQDYLPEMVRHIEQTAATGADLTNKLEVLVAAIPARSRQ